MGLTERLAILVDAKTGGAITELNKLNAEVNAVNRTQVEATGATGFLEKGLNKLGIESNNAGALLKAGVAAGAATAGYAIVGFAKDAVKASVDWADSIRTVQRATGQTAEESSRLTAIMDDYQIPVESGAKAFARLGRSIYDNGDVLKQYGVEVARSKDGNVDMQKTLGNIADAYNGMQDPAAKASLVNDAFGKTGRDLIPILEQGRKGIQDMYGAVPDKQIFSQQQLDNAQQYKLAMDNLSDVMMEVKVTIGNALLPALTDLANAAATVGRAVANVDHVIPGFSSNLVNLALTLNPVTAGLVMWGKALGAANDPGKEFVESLDAQSRHQLLNANVQFTSIEQMKQYIQTLQTKNADKQYEIQLEQQANQKIQDSIDLIYRRINANLGVEGAQLNVASAMERTNQVLSDGNSTELERAQAVMGSKTAIESYITAIKAAAVANGDASGGVQKQIDTLTYLMGTLAPDSPLRAYLQQYIDSLNSIPGYKSTHVDLSFVGRWTDDTMPPPPDWPGGADGDPLTPYPMAKGGIVTGPTNALIGEAGPEAVIPLSGRNGLGTTINLVLDGEVISRVVRQDLISIGRANGSSLGQFA